MCMSGRMGAIYVPGTHGDQRTHQVPRTGVAHSCELPCGCWELNLGPLEEQLVLLTDEPCVQHQNM